jgi:ATP-binding cassette subfamily F protein uup
VALLGDGSLAELPGGVEDYLARRARAKAAAAAPERTPAAARTGDTRAARKELTRLERDIAKYEKQEAVLHAKLAEQATDYAAVATLDAELRQVVTAREAAEEAWLQLSDG